MSVFANKKSIVHAGDGLKFVAAAPDVCKTPSPGGPIPVPYPNFAMSSDLGDGTKKVKIEGKSVAVKGAKLKTSTGDEAGTAGGGIVSSKTKGVVKWLSCSMNVKFEGKGVILFLTPTMHNGNMANAPGITVGEIAVDETINAETHCVHCGGDLFDETIHPPFKTDDDTMMTEAKTTSGNGGVSGALKVDGNKKTYKAKSGKGHKTHDYGEGKVFNMASCPPRELKLSKAQREDIQKPSPTAGKGFAIGNCAEPQIMHQAFVQDKTPWPGHGGLDMGCVNANNGSHREPCATCERTLVAMMCEEEPNQHVKKEEEFPSGDYRNYAKENAAVKQRHGKKG